MKPQSLRCTPHWLAASKPCWITLRAELTSWATARALISSHKVSLLKTSKPRYSGAALTLKLYLTVNWQRCTENMFWDTMNVRICVSPCLKLKWRGAKKVGGRLQVRSGKILGMYFVTLWFFSLRCQQTKSKIFKSDLSHLHMSDVWQCNCCHNKSKFLYVLSFSPQCTCAYYLRHQSVSLSNSPIKINNRDEGKQRDEDNWKLLDIYRETASPGYNFRQHSWEILVHFSWTMAFRSLIFLGLHAVLLQNPQDIFYGVQVMWLWQPLYNLPGCHLQPSLGGLSCLGSLSCWKV